jgi:hypothetical protein
MSIAETTAPVAWCDSHRGSAGCAESSYSATGRPRRKSRSQQRTELCGSWLRTSEDGAFFPRNPRLGGALKPRFHRKCPQSAQYIWVGGNRNHVERRCKVKGGEPHDLKTTIGSPPTGGSPKVSSRTGPCLFISANFLHIPQTGQPIPASSRECESAGHPVPREEARAHPVPFVCGSQSDRYR